MTAWLLDEAIAFLIMKIQDGAKILKNEDTDNRTTLERLGVKIKEKE